jgi:hypothetical protein
LAAEDDSLSPHLANLRVLDALGLDDVGTPFVVFPDGTPVVPTPRSAGASVPGSSPVLSAAQLEASLTGGGGGAPLGRALLVSQHTMQPVAPPPGWVPGMAPPPGTLVTYETPAPGGSLRAPGGSPPAPAVSVPVPGSRVGGGGGAPPPLPASPPPAALLQFILPEPVFFHVHSQFSALLQEASRPPGPPHPVVIARIQQLHGALRDHVAAVISQGARIAPFPALPPALALPQPPAAVAAASAENAKAAAGAATAAAAVAQSPAAAAQQAAARQAAAQAAAAQQAAQQAAMAVAAAQQQKQQQAQQAQQQQQQQGAQQGAPSSWAAVARPVGMGPAPPAPPPFPQQAPQPPAPINFGQRPPHSHFYPGGAPPPHYPPYAPPPSPMQPPPRRAVTLASVLSGRPPAVLGGRRMTPNDVREVNFFFFKSLAQGAFCEPPPPRRPKGRPRAER